MGNCRAARDTIKFSQWFLSFVYAVGCLFFLPQLVFVLFFVAFGGYEGARPLIVCVMILQLTIIIFW